MPQNIDGVESRVGKKSGHQHDNRTLSLDWGDEPENSNRVGFTLKAQISTDYQGVEEFKALTLRMNGDETIFDT
jgi:hypothetical protein